MTSCRFNTSLFTTATTKIHNNRGREKDKQQIVFPAVTVLFTIPRLCDYTTDAALRVRFFLTERFLLITLNNRVMAAQASFASLSDGCATQTSRRKWGINSCRCCTLIFNIEFTHCVRVQVLHWIPLLLPRLEAVAISDRMSPLS
jgi:hypothetical protein